MTDIRQRMMFLMQFEAGKDIRVIKEEVETLVESRQTDMQALGFLKKNGIPEDEAMEALRKLAGVDNTKNKILSVPFAIAYASKGKGFLNDIIRTFATASQLVNDMRIAQPMGNDRGIVVNDKAFGSYEQFAEFINNTSHLSSGYKEWESDISVKTDKEPIFPRAGHPEDEKSGLMIYDGNEVGRCIHYGLGGISGKYYEFCIAKPANTNWQGYRDEKTSTFYFVFDKTRSLDDPLHMTVVDHTQNGWEVTDVKNTTNTIAEYGRDLQGFIDSLAKRGVPVDEIFKHQPKTSEEKGEQEKLGKQTNDLTWFKSLSFKEKTKYIGRGHKLSDEQFNYLWSYRKTPGGFHLLHQYVDIGHALPESQFNILVSDAA